MSSTVTAGCPYHAALDALTGLPARGQLFVSPVPRAPRRLVSALARGGAALSDFLNAPTWHWPLRGHQLNPFRVAAHLHAERSAGVDPVLPRDYIGVIGALGKGSLTHQRDCFARFRAIYGQNRERATLGRAAGRPMDPRTPDGDTWTYTLPARPLVRFAGPNAVDTGFSDPDGPMQAVYVIRGATALRAVLTDAQTFDRGALPYHYLQQALGSASASPRPDARPAGLFAGQIHDNATWKDDRRLGVRMFGPKQLTDLIPGMSDALDEICDEIDARIDVEPHATVDAGVMMSRVAYRMVMRAAFAGVPIDGFRELGEALTEPVRTMLAYVHDQVMGRPSDAAAFAVAVADTKRLIAQIATRVREADAAGRIAPEHRREGAIRLILEEDVDADRLFAFLLPIVFGGHETTGHTLAWALVELGRDPVLARRIVGEIDAWRATHGDGPITPRGYDERPLTQALLYEIGRRHPAVIAVPRSSTRAGEMPPDPGTGIGAFRYPAGALFLCSILGAHFNPEVWPEPEDFRIDRWLDGVDARAPLVAQGRQVAKNARRAEAEFHWFTFGAGPAKCLGQPFNQLEFFLVLDRVLSRFRFELVDPDRVIADADDPISGPEAGRVAVRIRRREPRR